MKVCAECELYYEDIENDCLECGTPLEKADFEPNRGFLDQQMGKRTPTGTILIVLLGIPCLFALGYAIYHIIAALTK
ncbi:MAG: hypothetical protein ACOYJD_00965 [Christensenellales bacterium]|jgi:hypothetical protein